MEDRNAIVPLSDAEESICAYFIENPIAMRRVIQMMPHADPPLDFLQKLWSYAAKRNRKVDLANALLSYDKRSDFRRRRHPSPRSLRVLVSRRMKYARQSCAITIRLISRWAISVSVMGLMFPAKVPFLKPWKHSLNPILLKMPYAMQSPSAAIPTRLRQSQVRSLVHTMESRIRSRQRHLPLTN